MKSFRLSKDYPGYQLVSKVGECILVKAQLYPVQGTNSDGITTDTIHKLIESTRKGYFTGAMFNYSVEDYQGYRVILFIRKDTDADITVVKPFETATQLEELTEKVNNLSSKLDEVRELLDSPYMPGCIDGLKQCIEKMREENTIGY